MAKKSRKTILVTGATGKQGGAVYRHLRAAGFPLRVLTRDPNKPEALALAAPGLEVVQGDLDDPASLARALDDIDGVYSVQDWRGGAEVEILQGINLIDAADRAGVSHFVYSSVIAADRNTGIPHFESKFKVEEHLRRKGLAFTIFRPVFFMENWLYSRDQIESGRLALPLKPDTQYPMVAVDDIGALVAQAFEHSGHWRDKVLDIASDEHSLTDIADAFSRTTGRKVEYQEIPLDAFRQQAGEEMALMYKWFQDEGFPVDLAALREQFPHLISFDRWLNTHWESKPVGERGQGVNA